MKMADFLYTARDMRGFIMISAVDFFRILKWPAEERETEELIQAKDRILEVRIFNSEEERKLFRTCIASGFTERTIRDADNRYPFFDEYQYLDINTNTNKETNSLRDPVTGEVTSSGGGRYALPLGKIKDSRVVIRYYLEQYPETGQARIRDWRVAGLKEGK